MKHILVLGAGHSTPYLIAYLLARAEARDWFVTVCDRDPALAQARVAGARRGQGIAFDVNDASARSALISKADVVVNMLTRPFQHLVAVECVHFRAHMITASYQDPRVRAIDADAHRKNLLILNEMGLDPGLDHMTAMSLIRRIHLQGGTVVSFRSYGSGLPAPDAETNPLRYVLTWNPRNVLLAGEDGALFKEHGKIRLLPFHEIFRNTWTVTIDGIGPFEAYPNRNALSYVAQLGLTDARTIIRATLRYPGWSETWQQIVHLGLTNEVLDIPHLRDLSYRDLTEMVLPAGNGGWSLEQRVAAHCAISPTGRIMENLRWLGLFSEETIEAGVRTAAEAMIRLIARKFAMPEGARDMVVLRHEIEAEYPGTARRAERITSTLVEYGEAGGFTAIAKTVGLPVAVATEFVLSGRIPLTGCHIPTHPAIYEPVLHALAETGIRFVEAVEPLGAPERTD